MSELSGKKRKDGEGTMDLVKRAKKTSGYWKQAMQLNAIWQVVDATAALLPNNECSLCFATHTCFFSICGYSKHSICAVCIAYHFDGACQWQRATHGSLMNLVVPLSVQVSCPICMRYVPVACPDPTRALTESNNPALPGIAQRVVNKALMDQIKSWFEECKNKLELEPTTRLPLIFRHLNTEHIQSYLCGEDSNSLLVCDFWEHYHGYCPEELIDNHRFQLSGMKAHLLVCPLRPVSCPHCKKYYPIKQTFQQHIYQACTEVHCHLCNVTGSWDKMQVHIKQHNSLCQTDMLEQLFSLKEAMDSISFTWALLKEPGVVRSYFEKSTTGTLTPLVEALQGLMTAVNMLRAEHPVSRRGRRPHVTSLDHSVALWDLGDDPLGID